MEDYESNYNEIARQIDAALAEFTGNAHEHFNHLDDSLTMTRDGFIKGVIRFQRLRDWVEGLAETHKKSKNPPWEGDI